ncbi:hypothetical protein FKM82_000808 [Ascaphus truei]
MQWIDDTTPIYTGQEICITRQGTRHGNSLLRSLLSTNLVSSASDCNSSSIRLEVLEWGWSCWRGFVGTDI